MKNRIALSFVVYGIFVASVIGSAAAQDSPDTSPDADRPLELSAHKAIELVLRNNLTLQSAKYDIAMSDTAYQAFQKKFSPFVNLQTGYVKQENPPTALSEITGTKYHEYDATVAISKIFTTGTNVSLGAREMYYDANDKQFLPGTPADPAFHKPSLFFNIQQELLKNSFGSSDRAYNKIFSNYSTMQRTAILNNLSGLVAGALIDYWTITVRKSSVENAKLELESKKQVRNIIARNVDFGLMESYDLNQFNALVAGAETQLELAEQGYRDALRNFLRTVDMPSETEIKGVLDLQETLPEMEPSAALKAGFAKRTDYRNAIMDLENRKMELGIQEDNSLPSLTLSLGGNLNGQDASLPDALRGTATTDYTGWNIRLMATYPLDDTENQALRRNAVMKLRQAELGVKRLKKEINDDIYSKLEHVKTQHVMLSKSKTSRTEAELYYQKILIRFGQGKASTVAMQNALDAMIRSRQMELESLVWFNVALLQLDLSKNEVFDKYGVDVEHYLIKIAD
ncbi:MAG: TolC family protein [Spirochaetes bacterium]|nr:MAG: TolC family protein [Spirochaetota bacterium]